MVTLPPSGVTPVTPAASVTVAPVAVPAQVIATDALIAALKQNVILPVIALQPSTTPQSQLQVQTPQGTIQLALPVAPNGLPLTPAQMEALLLVKSAQLQLAPPGLPTALPSAQLLIPAGDWQQVLRAAPPEAATTSLPPQTPTAPARFTATLLPPPLAAAFGLTQPEVAPPPLLTPFLIPPATQNYDQPGQSPLPTLTIQVAPDKTMPLPAGALTIEAQIAARTPKGDILVQLPKTGETLLLPQVQLSPQAASLPVGASLPLTVMPADDGFVAPPGTPQIDTRTETHTPVLKEALAALDKDMPELARLLDNQTVMKLGLLPLPTQPNAPPQAQLGGSLLFMLAALGTTIKTPTDSKPPQLHRAIAEALGRVGAPELATRLTGELQALVTTVQDQQGYEWRSAALPTLMTEQLMAPLNFYVQRRYENDDDASDTPNTSIRDRQTRFVVDLHLSKLGHTQLEGLSKPRQLDLALRTDQALAPTLQRDLNRQYQDILAATGLNGSITFNRGNWLAFTAPAHHRSV